MSRHTLREHGAVGTRAWLSVQELADYIGWTVWDVSGLIEDGELAAYKIGEVVRVRAIDCVELELLYPGDWRAPYRRYTESEFDDSMWLPIPGAAYYLGVSWSVVNRLITAGKLPTKPTTRELDAYLARVRVPPGAYKRRTRSGR